MAARKSPQDEGPQGALDPTPGEVTGEIGEVTGESAAAKEPPKLEEETERPTPEQLEALDAFAANMKARDTEAPATQPPAAEAAPPPEPTYVRAAAQLDAAVFAAADPNVFDENGVYVVLESAIALPYGPEGEWREPALHGDYIAAEAQEGIRGLACVELRSPADQNRIGQKASDGRQHLRELWERGKIVHPLSPVAAEARKNRVAFDKIVAQHGADRLGDPRLNIIAAGGRVADYAYGERVR